ncbi:methyltransferase-like 26 isoform X2 [Oratosquilla oratoria]
MSEGKLVNASAGRNQGPILQILQTVIPEKFADSNPLNALEIASGTGQHVALFAKSFPNITWQPSELESRELESIKAHLTDEGLSNIKQPLFIDISKPLGEWSGGLEEGSQNVIICINMIHISPWECTEGLFRAAGALLASGGILVTYGAYAIHGKITPESNVAFDANLKGRNPSWGLRDIDVLEKEAEKNGMSFDAMFDMPSNNKTLIFLKK